MSRYTEIKRISYPSIDSSDPNSINDKVRFKGVKYPQIPLAADDLYVYAEEGDRFDILASQYYGDSSLWWIISTANENLPQNSYYLPLAQQIRIPQNTGAIISSYNELNSR